MGPLRLSAQPVVNSLSALTQAWKLKFASFLHSQAQVSLSLSLSLSLYHSLPLN